MATETKQENKDAQAPEKKEGAASEAKESKSAPVSGKLAELIQSIGGMTVLELSELVKALEDKFGVSAAVPMAVAGAPGAGAAGGGEAAEEKTAFDVVLKEVGSNKIQVIKELRTVTTLGLKEAKDLVESAPKPVKTGATKEEAETVKKKLEAAGAKVELQ